MLRDRGTLGKTDAKAHIAVVGDTWQQAAARSTGGGDMTMRGRVAIQAQA